MADMANKPSINSLVYDQLSFLEYDWKRPRWDTEWLLSTLFDASLLEPLAALLRGFFLAWHFLLCGPPFAPLRLQGHFLWIVA